MRALAVGWWPTLLIASACIGLALSNLVRPPTSALAAVLLVAAGGVIAFDDGARLVLLAVCLAAAGLWWGTLRLDALDASPLSAEVGHSGPALVVVTGPARRGRFELRIPAETRSFRGAPVRQRAQLELPLGRAPPQGSVLELRVRVVRPRGLEAGFDERGWLARRGVHVVLEGERWHIVGRRGGVGGVADRLRAHVDGALARGLHGERRAVVAGVVLGEDEGLSPELRDAFRASGLYHLLAVSGQNVLYITLGVLAAARIAGVGQLPAQLGVAAAIAAYVLAVGWQPPVVRAGVAGLLTSFAWVVARRADRWHFLALGALVLLTWMPATLREPGFQLSFAAVAAIFLWAAPVRGLLGGYPLPPGSRDVLALSAVCGLATAPILLLQFGTVPLYAVVANALAAPAVGPLLGLGLLAAAVEPAAPAAVPVLGWVNGWLAAYVAWCARSVAGLPFAELSTLAAFAVAFAVVLAVATLRRMGREWRIRLAGAAAAAAALLLVGAGLGDRGLPPPNALRIVFLDVGQGDAVLVQVPEGNVLVDQGPPEARTVRQLRDLGVRRLEALVLTHPQRDHIGGAAEILRRLQVGRVLDPGLAVDGPERREALAAARERGVPVSIARAGDVFRLGRLVLKVVWPDGPGPPGGDPNDRAIVLLASYGATDTLLTADAESNVTARLALRQVEVLKVAHHGSEDAGLGQQLRELRPQVAVISVGRGNDYGHPRRETLDALAAAPRLRVYRTDADGRVIVESDGRTLTVRSER